MANTQTTQTGYPSWLEQPIRETIGDVQKWLKSPQNYVYGQKEGGQNSTALFTPLDPMQNKAISKMSWLGNLNPTQLGGLFGINDATKMVQGVQGRLVDEGGTLGKISDYTNPFLNEVLNPQIRAINEQLQSGVRDLGASQQSAGAFGDARHGVFEGRLYDDAAENVSDITGRAHAAAWDDAMNRRMADRDNAYKGAGAIADLGKRRFDTYMDANDALFNAGDTRRDAAEEKRVAVEKFRTAIKDKKYNDALKLLGVINGTSQPTTTTTETKSNDGIGGIIGALLGAFL